MQNGEKMDPFLSNYTADEIKIAVEFLSNWMPFLSRGLCESCTGTLSDAIRSLETDGKIDLNNCKEDHGGCTGHSNTVVGSSISDGNGADTRSLGNCKDGADGITEQATQSSSNSSNVKKSWADMTQEDEIAEDEEDEDNEANSEDSTLQNPSVEGAPTIKPKVELSREQRECIRFKNVQRQKDFLSFERVNGKLVNVLQGLELHTGVFSAAEQRRIVSFVEELQEKGKNGLLKERTYTAPQKWMRGKGRVTLQFGCCYNYATDKNGNPPGILKNEAVDALPPLFKTMIKRLIRWHVLPPSCVPDSCIVNIYEEGDCIPPHIDHHDFFRPFCTVSFLSECKILFGTNLKIVGPGEFSGNFFIPLPLGSVLVLNGNGADVAKHCVPAVPSKRISITFRKMDESKHPSKFVPESDLQGLEPLPLDEVDNPNESNSRHNYSRKPLLQEDRTRGGGFSVGRGRQRNRYRHKYQN